MFAMRTTELSFWVAYTRSLGGDYRSQLQVATLSSMVSGLALKKPVSLRALMPGYPWAKKRRKSAKAVRQSIRAMALAVKRGEGPKVRPAPPKAGN